MVIRLILCILALLLGGGSARAQDSVAVSIGARIRVRTLQTDDWRTGTLAFVRSDSLGLHRCAACAPETHWLPSLATVELSSGSGPSPRRGLAGLGLGAVLGAVGGAVSARTVPDCSGDICGLRAGAVSRRTRIGGLLGGAGGLALGLSFNKERWATVTVLARAAR